MSDETKTECLNTGGPAFPIAESSNHGSYFGMTLLDYFAGQALAGLNALAGSGNTNEQDARQAYAAAAAMLAEKRRNEGND